MLHRTARETASAANVLVNPSLLALYCHTRRLSHAAAKQQLMQLISGIPLVGSPPAQQPILTRGRTLPPSVPVPLHHVEEAEEEEAVAEAAAAAAAAADADIELDIQQQHARTSCFHLGIEVTDTSSRQALHPSVAVFTVRHHCSSGSGNTGSSREWASDSNQPFSAAWRPTHPSSMRTVFQSGWVRLCRAAHAGAAPGGTPFRGGANTSWPAILLDLSLSASTSLRPLRLLRRTRRALLGARGVTFAAASCAHTAAAALPRQFSSIARHGTAATAHLRLNTVMLTGFVLALIAQQFEDLASLLASLPRTMRTVAWAIKAGLSYRHFQSVHGVGREEEEYLAALSLQHTRWAEKLLHVCRTNGGIYVKAGQFASAFGVVPMEYRKTLQQLEDQAVPRPYSSVRRVLLAELGPELDALFSEFAHESTAAASLAQERHWQRQRLALDLSPEPTPATGFRLPQFHLALCSKKVIVMEWIDGCKVTGAGEAASEPGHLPIVRSGSDSCCLPT
ncbi:MAG: hypothetical protein WDW38_007221 [Sanguina aurantia]